MVSHPLKRYLDGASVVFPWMWLFSRATPEGPCSLSLLRSIHALGFVWALCCVLLLYKLWKRTEHTFICRTIGSKPIKPCILPHYFLIFFSSNLYAGQTFFVFDCHIVNLYPENCRHIDSKKYFIHLASFVRLIVLFVSEIIDSFHENIHSGRLSQAMRVVKD